MEKPLKSAFAKCFQARRLARLKVKSAAGCGKVEIVGLKKQADPN
jgi:hypothetical protein